MGYTILLQWTYNPPNRPIPLSEIILNRILEHYNLAHPLRTTVQLRTYRASIPTSSGPANRLLTTIAYSQPVPPTREAAILPTPRDDVTYLFLDDRGLHIHSAEGGTTEEDKTSRQSDGKVNGEGTLEEDGFEIINPVATSTAPAALNVGSGSEGTEQAPKASEEESRRYRTIAVRPSGALLPLLQNLLSPFVMGLTKSARAAALTTAEAARPNPLPGISLVLASLTFPSLSPPSPPITLTIHNLPNPNASSIFLEAELEGVADVALADAILREFLQGCLPEGIGGESKFVVPGHGSETEVDSGWSGVERTKRATEMLARTLREGGYM